jgi:hypothetical protein
MNWYKKSQSQSFQDFFKEDMDKWKGVKEIKRDNPISQPITLTLYRGFDYEPQKINNEFILSPEKSEQGVLWFAQNKKYAEGRGKYMLTYPLQATKHTQKIHYSNGQTSDTTPQEILDQNNPTENCKFYGGIELPEGWLFSYKTEKHVICLKKLIVSPGMIKVETNELV